MDYLIPPPPPPPSFDEPDDPKYQQASALFDEGEVLMREDSTIALQRAIAKFLTAQQMFEEIGDQHFNWRLHMRGWRLLNTGIVNRWLEQYDEAETHLRVAAHIFSQAGESINVATVSYELGHVKYDLGQYPTALDLYTEAILYFEQDRFSSCAFADIHTFIADAYRELDCLVEAAEHYKKSLPIYREYELDEKLAEELKKLGCRVRQARF